MTFDDLVASCYPKGSMTIQFTAHLDGLGSGHPLSALMSLAFRDCTGGEILVDNRCTARSKAGHDTHRKPVSQKKAPPRNEHGTITADIHSTLMVQTPEKKKGHTQKQNQ